MVVRDEVLKGELKQPQYNSVCPYQGWRFTLRVAPSHWRVSVRDYDKMVLKWSLCPWGWECNVGQRDWREGDQTLMVSKCERMLTWTKMVAVGIETPWSDWSSDIKINFLSQTEDNFPLLVQLPLPKIKFISACFFLYTIKEKLFAVWFWDPHRFLRSEHSPYYNRLSDETLFLSNQIHTFNRKYRNLLHSTYKNKTKAF